MKILFLGGYMLLLSSVASAQWTNGTTDISNTNTGNVGIGTSTPATKLHVNGLIRGSNFFDLNSGMVIGQVGNGTMTGGRNVIAGSYAGIALTTGSANTIIGADIANAMTTGAGNVIMGSYHGGFNLRTAQSLTTGYNNIMIGPGAGGYTTTGYQNVFVGPGAGAAVSTGRQNTELGYSAGLSSNGNFNTLVGSSAGQSLQGDYNTVIGQAAGNSVSSGTSVTFIGAGAGNTGTTAGLTNATAIGYNTQVTASNSLILGNGANVGIGTTSPSQKFHVQSAVQGDLKSLVENTGVGATATASYDAKNDNGKVMNFGISSSAYSNNALIGANSSFCYSDTPLGFALILNGTNSTFRISTGGLIERFRIDLSGNVGIGTTTPDAKLAVNGSIHAKEVKVDMNILPDYVFKPGYDLLTLDEVKRYIDKNQHLPGVPSAEQTEKEGLKLGEMNAVLLKKVEELTLYVIESEQKNDVQQKALSSQEKRIKLLETKLNILLSKSK
jgi:hypothetical protein